MTRTWRGGAIALVVAVANIPRGGVLEADEPTQELARFTVGKNARALFVPGAIDDKTYRFALDTGCSRSVFDTTLCQTPLTGKAEAETPDGMVSSSLHRPPRIAFGGIEFPRDRDVISMDLTGILDPSGCRTDGILGMDFLKRYVVQIDVAKGEVRFLRTVPSQPGEAVDLFFGRGVPFGFVRIGNLKAAPFLVDTGDSSDVSATISQESADELVAKHEVEFLGRRETFSVTGSSWWDVHRVKNVTLENIAIDGPAVLKGRVSVLSLQFLSRFVATFDFPNGKLYLRRGPLFQRRDLPDFNGLHVGRAMGELLVESVDVGSTAAMAGVCRGDRIVEVEERDAKPFRPADLMYLCRRSAPLVLKLKRGEETISVRVETRQ